jgi:hypothetical protein
MAHEDDVEDLLALWDEMDPDPEPNDGIRGMEPACGLLPYPPRNR